MKCEADFGKCKNKAIWKLTAFNLPAALFVCNHHKIIYEKDAFIETIGQIEK